MAHPYAQHKEHHAGKARVHKMHGHFNHGGKVEREEEKKERRHEHKADGGKVKTDMKATGGAAKPRLDKFARGGKTKHGGKAAHHHTKINIMVAPKGGDSGGGL